MHHILTRYKLTQVKKYCRKPENQTENTTNKPLTYINIEISDVVPKAASNVKRMQAALYWRLIVNVQYKINDTQPKIRLRQFQCVV
jgi:hypothetical protein